MMTTQEQRNGLKLSIAIIGFGWILQIVNAALTHGAAVTFLFPEFSITGNLPVATIYLIGMSIFTLVLSLWLLRRTGEGMSDLGFVREESGKQFLTGAGFGLGVFVVNTFLLLPLLGMLMPGDRVTNRELFSNATNICLMLFLSVFKGGFMEEFWRIFVLTRFEKLFGRAGLIVALMVSSVLFGLGHAYQGRAAIIGTAVIGFINALIFLRKRRALEAVAAHAVFDVVGVVVGAVIYSR